MAVLAACGGSSSSSTKGTPTTTASTVRASRGGSFCKQIADTYNEALTFAGATARSPDELRTELDKTLKDGKDTINAAPDEVKADLQVIQDAVAKFSDSLAKVGYDVNRLGSDAIAAISVFTSPEFQKAAEHSQTYVKDQCGIDISPSTTTK